jgi:FixJ family two-component response regulator
MSRLPQIYVAVVDNDESLCRSLERLLRASHMQAVTYSSAEAFLADTKRPQFDCMVFDIQLGGMSGIELHRHLTASGSTTPVIYLTAHDAPAVRQEALAAGCIAFYHKTESGEEVLRAIRQVLDPPPSTCPSASRIPVTTVNSLVLLNLDSC